MSPPGGWPSGSPPAPQSPVFACGLVRVAGTGAISRALKTQLRIHAHAAYPDRPQAGRLMDYCVDHGRARSSPPVAGPAQADGPQMIALARRDPTTRRSV